MFQVPVTFCAPDFSFLEDSIRPYLFHEFASNGAKHVVLQEMMINRMLASANFAQMACCELRYEGMSFVDAHAPYGELLDMNCPIPSFRPLMLETQKRTIELCASLGVKTLTIHVGNNHWMDDPKMRSLEYNRQCIENTLETLLPVAEACGVIICIENIWFQTNTPEELLRYKKLFPTDALGFCYDAGHANIMADVPGREHPMLGFWKERNGVERVPLDNHILEKMLPHVVNCHLHDNVGGIDQHVNIGLGNVPWERIIPVLKKAPRLACVQSEVSARNHRIGVHDLVEKFNWLGSLE